MKFKFWEKDAADAYIKNALSDIEIRWHNERSGLGLEDAVGHVRPLSISSSRIITKIRNTVKSFISQITRNGSFEPPEWDFEYIDKAIRTESLLRRAIEKYVEQIWKNGFEFTGKNPGTVKYIRKRFRQIAQVTGVSTFSLLQKIAYSLVAYQNAIIVKRRSEKASGGRIRTTFDGKMLKPVAGYFVLSPTVAQVDKNEYGNVRYWSQKPTHQSFSLTKQEKWRPEDVVFIKDSGVSDSRYLFALPMALPVIPDIKALRETEELAMLQAVKFSTPRYHAKIGSKEKPGLQEELDYYASYLDSMPSDSVIITSNRVEMDGVSSQDQVLDLSPYLKHWWQRILSGMGMSGVGMGVGDTANKSTAQTMTSEMQNTSIKYQQVIKTAVEEYIIKELLYEIGYTEDTLNEDSMVSLHIPPIDLDSKIKVENHAMQLFMQNAITSTEMRTTLGKDKFTPADMKDTYFSMFGSPSTGAVDNKDKPANQYGKQNAKPAISKNS